jgi:hypothetical protein
MRRKRRASSTGDRFSSSLCILLADVTDDICLVLPTASMDVDGEEAWGGRLLIILCAFRCFCDLRCKILSSGASTRQGFNSEQCRLGYYVRLTRFCRARSSLVSSMDTICEPFPTDYEQNTRRSNSFIVRLSCQSGVRSKSSGFYFQLYSNKRLGIKYFSGAQRIIACEARR